MLRACLGQSSLTGFWDCAAVRRDLAAAAARLAPLVGRQAAPEAELFAADALLAEERAQTTTVTEQLRASTAEANSSYQRFVVFRCLLINAPSRAKR